MNFPRRLAGVLALAVVAVLGCTDSGATSTGPWGTVVASALDGRIRISNRTSRPIYTAAFGQDLASRISWTQCVDPISCPPIAPGETKELLYPSAMIPEGETAALVYWWHARTGTSGEAVPDGFNSLLVKL